MEALLKYLLKVCRFDGPLSEFKKRLASQTSEYSKMTLGQLVAAVPERLFNTELVQSQRPTDITEPWLTFSFGFDQGNAVLTEWASQLVSLKNDRNALVHHFFDEHQLKTLEACDKVSAELDALMARTQEPYNFVFSMVQGINAHFDDIQAGRVKFTEQPAEDRA